MKNNCKQGKQEIQTELIKAMADKGFDNKKIAEFFGISVNKVSGVVAWHKHRKNWLVKGSKNKYRCGLRGLQAL